MTTIILTQDFIASDGLSTNAHDRVMSRSEAKMWIRNGTIYALSGTSVMIEPLINWLSRHDGDPEKVPKCDATSTWSLLVIDAAGAAIYHNTAPYRDRVEVPFAIGSGGDYALGAIAAGADARRAIEIAALYNTSTGGEIQVINIAEALGLNQIQVAAE